MHLTLVGLSHKTAPIEIREKLTFPAHIQTDALSALTDSADVAEAVIVSTCNRTEVYAVTTGEDEGRDAVIDFLARYHALDRHELVRYLYVSEGGAVVRHLFRVVASLDSMVVGEAQILGQVKEAYGYAFESGTCGRIFNKLFRQSFEVGKRVRTETEIGESAVSISYAAIELAKKVFDTLEGRSILILGAGKMSELTAKHLLSNGVARVMVSNRTLARAQELAERFEGEAVPWEDMYDRLHEADIVISSTAAEHFVVTKDKVAAAMKHRGSHPLFFIDIALPRDVEPSVNDLSGVFVYDIDDLSGVVESNLEERMREARRAEGIIDEELGHFASWLEGLEVVPTIAAMRANADRIRTAELEKALKRLGHLSEKEVRTVEALTEAIVNKMLHAPTARLRAAAEQKDGYEYVEAARMLYGLDETERPAGGGLLKSLLGGGERASKRETGDTVGY